MKMPPVVFLLLLLFIHKSVWGQTRADGIVGIWLTNGKEPAKIQIYKSGERYYGKIAWLKNPMDHGRPKTDTKNPDKGKCSQPILGLVILTSFRFDGNAEWEDGKIYDPESGKTYSCYLSLKDQNTLKVRGYIGVSLLGRTEVWAKSSW